MRVTYSGVTATLALVVALSSGGAYAANTLIPKNSVGAPQIKKNAVRSAEIRKDAVGASELKPRAVGASEVRNGSLTAPKFAPGALASGLSGAPLGGDLAGTFPNPRLSASALQGVLHGKRIVSRVTLDDFGTGPKPLVKGAGIEVIAACSGLFVPGHHGDSLSITVKNTSKASQSFVFQSQAALPAATEFAGFALAPNAQFPRTFLPDDPGLNKARTFTLQSVTGPELVLKVTALVNVQQPEGGGCSLHAELITPTNAS